MSETINALLFEKLWVAAEPKTTLINWSIHELIFPTYEEVGRHLVGNTSTDKCSCNL